MNNCLTILTPTYNRAIKLKKLYHSLICQSNMNFIWFVMDDGSEDNTEKLIHDFMEEGKLEILYSKKKNGGKHTALNAAMPQLESELVFIVDSDDFLAEDAVELICKYHDKYRHTTGLCGYSFLRTISNYEYLTTGRLPADEFIDTFVNCRINQNIPEDMAEVWYTTCLKRHPFPEFHEEKFLAEDVVWLKMSGPNKLVFINKAIYYCEYLDDGLTRNRRKNNIDSPQGCVLRAKLFLEADIKARYTIKPALQYVIYGFFAKYKIARLFHESPRKLWFVLAFLPACILFFVWRTRLNK